MLRKILLAGSMAMATTVANAGGILMCDQFHCRSVVEFPPPIVAVLPPVISTQRPVYYVQRPPVQLPAQPPRLRLWNWERGPLPSAPPPLAQRDPPPPPLSGRRSRPNVEVPPPDDSKADIEGDVMEFCDAHPDERFCGKLGSYLRAHPEAAPKGR